MRVIGIVNAIMAVVHSFRGDIDMATLFAISGFGCLILAELKDQKGT